MCNSFRRYVSLEKSYDDYRRPLAHDEKSWPGVIMTGEPKIPLIGPCGRLLKRLPGFRVGSDKASAEEVGSFHFIRNYCPHVGAVRNVLSRFIVSGVPVLFSIASFSSLYRIYKMKLGGRVRTRIEKNLVTIRAGNIAKVK